MDAILQRLRAANDAELRGIADALGVALCGERDVDVVTISKELRSAAGNSFANVLRGDHDLPYRTILEAVVVAAGELAGFRKITPAPEAPDEWLEEYVFQASGFAERAKRGSVSEPERLGVQAAAEAALHGHAAAAGAEPAALAGTGVLAAGVVAVALGVTGLPFGIAYAAIKWSRPAMKKVLPAVLWLIEIRKRGEKQSDVQAELLCHLLDEAESYHFVDGFIAPFMAARAAFQRSDLDEAIRRATEARDWVIKAIELSERGRATFPHEPTFAALHRIATGVLSPVEQFVADVQAFKALVDIEPPARVKVESEREVLLRKIADLLKKLET